MRQQSDSFMTYTDQSQGSTDCECASHTSIYDDGWIKIYKGEGADRQQIIKIEEANDTDLYDRAREAVISWENSKKERNARR